jgi:SAM-dependent methyltransferase
LANARRMSFDVWADEYRTARPPYPDRVYDLLVECGLGPGCRVVEVGPGTGQATRELLARGASVLAVEPGANLAAHLTADLGSARLQVIVSEIESVELAPEQFDLAVSATAFHWVNAEVAVPKLARALRPGGWLAVWWNVYGDPDRLTPFRAALDQLYRRRLPQEHRELTAIPDAMQVADRTAELARGGFQSPVRAELIRWEHQLTSAGARRLFGSFSNLNELPAEERSSFLDSIAAIIDELGGVVADPYVTAVYLAQRLA